MFCVAVNIDMEGNTMKLSEAILKGSEENAQCFDGHWGEDELGNTTTCALSAAAVAAGIMDRDGFPIGKHEISMVSDSRTSEIGYRVAAPASFTKVMTSLSYSPCTCPFAKTEMDFNTFIIWHLNDIHHWTREAVALWISTIEDAMEQPVELYGVSPVEACKQEEQEAQESVDMYNDIFESAKV